MKINWTIYYTIGIQGVDKSIQAQSALRYKVLWNSKWNRLYKTVSPANAKD